ncbi:hypothetical protein JL49_21740 [Pseudoalteromonas luteoviolacea]|nr:hypothetical protein JL49_21740 [Pseudoalteromonas luteoviolacea]
MLSAGLALIKPVKALDKFDVGSYVDLRGKVFGLDAHHVGQKAIAAFRNSLKNDGVSQHFEYDNLGRLTFAKGEYGQLTYGYDQVGNRLNRKWVSKDRQVLEDEGYQYAMNSNQLQRVTPSAKPVRVLNYNENGQTILDTLKGKSLVYNTAKRLSKIAFNDGSHVEYIYNAKGPRIQHTNSRKRIILANKESERYQKENIQRTTPFKS